MNKALLILCDGMRSDVLTRMEKVEKFKNHQDIGHDRIHGTDSKEDTTIPFFFMGEKLQKSKSLLDVKIIDLAPTIVDIIGATKDKDWEGKSL